MNELLAIVAVASLVVWGSACGATNMTPTGPEVEPRKPGRRATVTLIHERFGHERLLASIDQASRRDSWQISAMGIFDRMGKVISANFNGLVDGLQDPRKSVEQTLLDMQEQIRAARREVVSAVAAEKQLRGKLDALDKDAEKWAARAELAVKTGDDDLAREALLQKKRVTAERDRAEALRGEQRAAAHEMKSELERMEAKVSELEQRKGTLVAQAAQAKAGGSADGLGAKRVGGSAFAEFRRMEDQIEAVETTVQAQRELDGILNEPGPGGMTKDEVESKFRKLEAGVGPTAEKLKHSEVDEELQAIKKRVRIDG